MASGWFAAGKVQVAGEPAHTGQHLEGADVQVRPLALPGVHDAVDLVAHVVGSHAAEITRRRDT